MATNYPASLDTGTSLVNNRVTGNTIPVSDHNDLANAMIATETKLGSGASVPSTANQYLKSTGGGATAWSSVTTGSVTKTVGFADADYICDGVADNVQIQQAVDAVIAAGGGMVYIKENTIAKPYYDIQTRVVVLGSRIHIRGAAQGATVLRLADNANQEIFVVGNGRSDDPLAGDSGTIIHCDDVSFSDMALNGNKANQALAANFVAVRYGPSATRNLLRYRSDAQGSYGGSVERIYGYNGIQNGLSCESHAQGTFSNNRIENCDQNGIWVENGGPWTITNNYTRDNGQDTAISGHGIRILSTSGIVVTGNTCKGDKGGGIRLQSSTLINVTNNAVYRAGWQRGVGDFAATGISASLCDCIAITGNTIYASQAHGLLLNGNKFTTVTGNTFRRNGQFADNTYADIYLTYEGGGSTNNNCSFVGNTFRNDTATFFTNRVKYNIQSFETSSGHTGNVFIGNRFDNPVTATVDKLFVGNTWGSHNKLNPTETFNYGFFNSPTKTIDPKDGNYLVGVGFNSNVTVTIANGIYNGQKFTFEYRQDFGNKQLTWASNVRFSGGYTPVLSGVGTSQGGPAGGLSDIIDFVWNASDNIWVGTGYVTRNNFKNYGYFVNTGTQNINPNLDGEVIAGTGFQGSTPINLTNGARLGQQFTLIFSQDVGNKQLTWSSNVQFSGGFAPVFGGQPNTTDVLHFTWNGSSWTGLISRSGGSLKQTGNVQASAIATPSAPLLVVNGTAGTTTYYYKIVALNVDEQDSVPSVASTVTTGAAVLNTTDFISMQWTAVPGANRYKVLKSTDNVTYQLLTTTTTLGYSDQGQSTPAAYTPAVVNPGGNLILAGKLNLAAGANQTVGTGTLAAGTVTISNTRVTANSLIFLTKTGTVSTGVLSVGTITAGTSFVVNSSLNTDTATFNWFIVN